VRPRRKGTVWSGGESGPWELELGPASGCMSQSVVVSQLPRSHSLQLGGTAWRFLGAVFHRPRGWRTGAWFRRRRDIGATFMYVPFGCIPATVLMRRVHVAEYSTEELVGWNELLQYPFYRRNQAPVLPNPETMKTPASKNRQPFPELQRVTTWKLGTTTRCGHTPPSGPKLELPWSLSPPLQRALSTRPHLPLSFS